MRSRSAVWRELHLSLERLYSDYARHGKDMAVPVLERALNPAVSRDTVKAEIAKRRLPIDLAADWPEFERLRAESFDGANLGTAEAPFEPVYQAACFFRKVVMRYPPDDDFWFYRGQRNHTWPCEPKIMRGLDKMDSDRREAALAAGLRKVRSVVSRIRQAGLANSDFDATAIAQHYSKELGVGTWLVDVTSSLWVALFFASHEGETGHLGRVDCIGRAEWVRYSGNGTTALGKLRVAEVKSVPRIENQNGFFLQAPHPALFDELFNEQRCFKQEEGVVFESPLLDPPIHRARIYPEEDKVLEAIRATAPADAVEPSALDWEPDDSTLMAPTWEVYLPIARALFDHHIKKLLDDTDEADELNWDSALESLCRIHAGARAQKAASLHHLNRAVKRTITYTLGG